MKTLRLCAFARYFYHLRNISKLVFIGSLKFAAVSLLLAHILLQNNSSTASKKWYIRPLL